MRVKILKQMKSYVCANYQLVELISKNCVVLNKSQVPKIKNEKEKAYLDLVQAYGKIFGNETTVKQLQKKIHNLKGKFKKKRYQNATGNKKIELKYWEHKLMLLLKTDKSQSLQR